MPGCNEVIFGPAHAPVALTIAGSDSGGEAGIQADLKTFAALKVHGTTAITCVTAQNRRAVTLIDPCPPKTVRAQLEAVAGEFSVASAKTGMLYSAPIIYEVARFFKRHTKLKLVVDPVMISTSGRRLLRREAIKALRNQLLPLATLVTPNIAEAEVLAGMNVTAIEDARAAATRINHAFGCAVLVKGGHLNGTTLAVDFLCCDEGEWMISTPRTRGVTLHGTGCVYSAAIAAWLARGRPLLKAVELAKTHIARVIQSQV